MSNSEIDHHTIRSALALARQAALATIALMMAGVCSAQDVNSHSQFGDSGSYLSHSVVPASFESVELAETPYGDVACYDCDGCDACGRHRSWFHQACSCWEGGLDVGLNGAEGNSRDTNMVIGLDLKRVSGLNTLTLDFDYFFQRESSEVTKNRVYTLGRFERDIPNTIWSWFGDVWYEYDQFEGWHSRIGLHAGAIAQLIDTDCSSLRALVGLGSSKKQRGSDTDWKPEAMLGAEYVAKISRRQQLKLSSIYYPDMQDTSSFRINTRGSWECLIDEEKDLSLAISAFDRYDSTPEPGDGTNELDYWLSIHWGF